MKHVIGFCDTSNYLTSSIVNFNNEVISNKKIFKLTKISKRLLKSAIIDFLNQEKLKFDDINFIALPDRLSEINLLIQEIFQDNKYAKIIKVNAIDASIHLAFIEKGNVKKKEYPFIALIANENGTQLRIHFDFNKIKIIGEENKYSPIKSIKKAEKLLFKKNLNSIDFEKYTKSGDENFINLTNTKKSLNDFDFNFSDLFNLLKKEFAKQSLKIKKIKNQKVFNQLLLNLQQDLLASFQFALNKKLIENIYLLATEVGISNLVITGHYSSNLHLRENAIRTAVENEFDLTMPDLDLINKDAAMLALSALDKINTNSFF